MTQQEKSQSYWKRQKIGDLLPEKQQIYQGRKGIADDLAVEEEGTVALIFSADLQNQQTINYSKRTTREKLAEKLKQPASEIKWKEDVFVPSNSVLVTIARKRAGDAGMHFSGEAVVNRAIAVITPDPQTLLPELLFYFFKNPHTREKIKRDFMPGGKPNVTLEDIKSLSLIIPPTRDQQEQMVCQIKTLLKQAESVQKLLQTNQMLINRLLEDILRDVFTEKRKKTWEKGRFADLVQLQSMTGAPFAGEDARYPLVEADDIDAAVAEIQIDSSTIGTPSEKTRGFLLSAQSESIIYASTFTADTNWQSRVAMPYYRLDASPEPLRCKNDLFGLTIKDPTRLHPRFLFWILADPGFTAQLIERQGFKNNVSLKPEHLPATELPLPKLDEQERISVELDKYQEKLHQMKKSHRDSLSTVEQMEGSILDQIFREEA